MRMISFASEAVILLSASISAFALPCALKCKETSSEATRATKMTSLISTKLLQSASPRITADRLDCGVVEVVVVVVVGVFQRQIFQFRLDGMEAETIGEGSV